MLYMDKCTLQCGTAVYICIVKGIAVEYNVCVACICTNEYQVHIIGYITNDGRVGGCKSLVKIIGYQHRSRL